ncbi:MAG: hypothetical protein IIW23_03160, partial [Clostridia bacterium]|nr:hypothetical protein [Clostridia bacterium]
DKAVADESGFMFLENSLLESFVYNLYGVGVPAAACEYAELPQMAGHTLILPRGGVDMSHSIVEIYPEEYGMLKVVSRAEIDPHDGEIYTAMAITRFAPCSASNFGWVIVSAEIME